MSVVEFWSCSSCLFVWQLSHFPPGSFVSDVVCIYYPNDEKVQEDEEIQAFIKDVCSFGMQDFDHCGGYTLQTSDWLILLLAYQQQTKSNLRQGQTILKKKFTPLVCH